MVKWFLWRRFFSFVNEISLFHTWIILEKRTWPFVLFDWLKWAHWFWRRRWKYVKFTNRRTDDRRQAIRKGHLCFQFSWTKNHFNAYLRKVDLGKDRPSVSLVCHKRRLNGQVFRMKQYKPRSCAKKEYFSFTSSEIFPNGTKGNKQ